MVVSLVVCIQVIILTLPSKETNDYMHKNLFDNDIESHIEVDLALERKIQHLYEAKLKVDREGQFEILKTELTEDAAEVAIPKYFLDPQYEKPDIQPFDPRLTIGIYYEHMLEQLVNGETLSAPFHWADWVDLSVLNEHFLLSETDHCSLVDAKKYYEDNKIDGDNPDGKSLEKFCWSHTQLKEQNIHTGNKLNLGFNVFDALGKGTREMSVLAGKSYLWSVMPVPNKVVFLTPQGSYCMETTAREKLLYNGMVENYVKRTTTKVVNSLQSFRKLLKKQPPPKSRRADSYEVELRHEDFVIEPMGLLTMLLNKQSKGEATLADLRYKNSLQQSLNQNDPPKYFQEARLFGDNKGAHYDWRFFRGLIHDTPAQTNALHRLVRAYLSFCRKNGITTWISHGSLLSWYWNAAAFPWDEDIDVQMPVMDLHKLSWHFNQSVVVENGEDGYGRYFVDCATYITSREHNNGRNNIDARFIDIDTGLYVDITGLAVSNEKCPDRYNHFWPQGVDKADLKNYEINSQLQVYNCRNRHFTSLRELSNLVMSYNEAEVAFIPQRFSDILTVEYPDGLKNTVFRDHYFLPQIRIWMHHDDLKFFLRDREQWLSKYPVDDASSSQAATPKFKEGLTDSEKEMLRSLEHRDIIDLLHKNELLISYLSTRELTAFHENEIMRRVFRKSTEKLMKKAPHFKPLKPDPFLFAMKEDSRSYEADVERWYNQYDSFRGAPASP